MSSFSERLGKFARPWGPQAGVGRCLTCSWSGRSGSRNPKAEKDSGPPRWQVVDVVIIDETSGPPALSFDSTR